MTIKAVLSMSTGIGCSSSLPPSPPQILKEMLVDNSLLAQELDQPLHTKIGFAQFTTPVGKKTLKAFYTTEQGECLPYERSPGLILFALLSKSPYARDLSILLQLFGPDFDEQTFLVDLLQPRQSNRKWIDQLSHYDLMTALSLFRKHALPIEKEDLKRLLFQDRPYFSLDLGLIQHLLSMDPSLIGEMETARGERAQETTLLLEEHRSSKRRVSKLLIPNLEKRLTFYQRTLLAHAILRGETETTAFLLKNIYAQKVSLSEEDLTLIRASELKPFTTQELSLYSPTILEALFQTANVYSHIPLLEMLRSLRPAHPPSSPHDFSLCSDDMDLIEAQKAVHQFFQSLRKEGKLFTLEECATKQPFEGKTFVKHTDPIGRMLGKEKLEKAIRSFGLDRMVGVPHKILFCQKKAFDVFLSKDPCLATFCPDCSLSLLAEPISRLDRPATHQELEALFQVIEATGYSDFGDEDNFMLGRNLLGEEKIYFLDTERKSFDLGFHHNYPFWSLVAPEDVEWLKEKLTIIGPRQYQKSEEEKKQRNFQNSERQPIFEKSGFPYRETHFHIDLETLNDT